MRIRWRGLELPSRVQLVPTTATPMYGMFVAEPFERGFGATIGNSLRRIMLTSLEGSSITKVRIQGVQHEFMTVPGVVEDVTDVCLNIKSAVVKDTPPPLLTDMLLAVTSTDEPSAMRAFIPSTPVSPCTFA